MIIECYYVRTREALFFYEDFIPAAAFYFELLADGFNPQFLTQVRDA